MGPAASGTAGRAQVAVVSGNPGSDGPYVVRAKLPSGYKIPPHTHPTDENVTILSGTFHIAMGDKFDATKGETLRAGGFFNAQKGMQHYGWSTGPTVIQIMAWARSRSLTSIRPTIHATAQKRRPSSRIHTDHCHGRDHPGHGNF